jgi:hypothetical protein
MERTTKTYEVHIQGISPLLMNPINGVVQYDEFRYGAAPLQIGVPAIIFCSFIMASYRSICCKASSGLAKRASADFCFVVLGVEDFRPPPNSYRLHNRSVYDLALFVKVTRAQLLQVLAWGWSFRDETPPAIIHISCGFIAGAFKVWLVKLM